MYTLYFCSVLIHILAATTWIGGMLFLVLVVLPWLRSGGRAPASSFLRETGVRFRNVGWTCFALLLITGTFNLWFRGVRFASFIDRGFVSSSFGHAVLTKLVVFAIVLGVSLWHDFIVGPSATREIERDPSSERTAGLRKQAAWLGRLNMLLGLVLVGAAITIVRGSPF